MNNWSERTPLDESHPCLAGHFPGNPLAPGVLLLDRVIQALERGWPDRRVVGMSMGKFMHPWRSGQTLDITLEASAEDGIRFACHHEGQLIAQGQFRVEHMECDT